MVLRPVVLGTGRLGCFQVLVRLLGLGRLGRLSVAYGIRLAGRARPAGRPGRTGMTTGRRAGDVVTVAVSRPLARNRHVAGRRLVGLLGLVAGVRRRRRWSDGRLRPEHDRDDRRRGRCGRWRRRRSRRGCRERTRGRGFGCARLDRRLGIRRDRRRRGSLRRAGRRRLRSSARRRQRGCLPGAGCRDLRDRWRGSQSADPDAQSNGRQDEIHDAQREDKTKPLRSRHRRSDPHISRAPGMTNASRDGTTGHARDGFGRAQPRTTLSRSS